MLYDLLRNKFVVFDAFWEITGLRNNILQHNSCSLSVLYMFELSFKAAVVRQIFLFTGKYGLNLATGPSKDKTKMTMEPLILFLSLCFDT